MSDKIILLVEDNQDDEELAMLAFERNHITDTVVVVRDGQEALDYLFGRGNYVGRNDTQQPHLVLLDLKLPRVDGLEVLAQIRADPRTARLPVVILTSSIEEEDLLASYARGANSYIRKPVDLNRFIEVLHQVQIYWIVLNNAPPTGR